MTTMQQLLQLGIHTNNANIVIAVASTIALTTNDVAVQQHCNVLIARYS